MPDVNPLDTHDEREQQRIRERAYHLWEAEGRPEGQSDDYWERARFLIGIEENPEAGLMNPDDLKDVVDEAALQDNLGEFPDRSADQGEWRVTPVAAQSLRASDRAEPSVSEDRGSRP